MLTADQTLVSNRASQTLPGSDASDVFVQVATNEPGTVLRRVTATALTTPQELRVIQALTGGNGFKRRRRTVVRNTITDLTADPADTGDIVPSASVSLTIDGPVNSGGAITDTMLKNMLGQIMDLFLISGQCDKLLAGEG